MKKLISILLAVLMLLTFASCTKTPVSNSTDSTAKQTNNADNGNTETGNTDTGNTENDNSQNKEGTISDINADDVVKIETDEIELPEESMYRTDYASTSYHAVYDFSNEKEIKNYDCVYSTDPNCYEDTNRIMEQTNCNPVWSNGNATVTVTRKYSMGMNAQDIIDSLQEDNNSFTAYMSDGSSIHVKF